jgi:5,10-methylenetetrahydrofolate reductase
MLMNKTDFTHIVEVNPPTLPNMSHLLLDGAWQHILVTDNVFGKIRVSPYAYAARITHDVPGVHPTVVVSTRDRNILAIESEVRGALGNGVDSFLVVIGDTMPQVDHLAHHYEIVAHLRDLQDQMPAFEVGMATRFRKWQFRKRVDLGAQFLVAGPVLDPQTIEPRAAELELGGDEPPVFLMVMPPFSPAWIDRAEGFGAVPATDDLKRRLEELDETGRREFGWEQTAQMARRAEDAGLAGVVVMGLRFETVVDEAASTWRSHFGQVADPEAHPHPR